VIIPILLITSSYIYLKNYKEIVDDMTDVYENLTHTVETNIDYLQADLMDLTTYLTINSDIRYILSSKKGFINKPLIWEQSAPTDFVRDMISIKSHIKTLILYPENGVRPFYISRDNSVYNKDINEVHSIEIYKSALKAKGDQVWTRVKKGETGLFIQNNSDKIIISRVIFDWAKKRRIGYLAIGIDANKYKQICEEVLQKNNEGIIITSQDGTELIRAGEVDETVLQYLKNNIEKYVTNSEMKKNHFEYNNYYIFCSQSEKDSNITWYMVPKTNWLSKIQNAKVIPIVFGGFLLIGLWPLSMLASTIISKPLNRLYKSMVKFKQGDFEQRVDVIDYDEIGEVTNCFNQMVIEIKELIDKNYVMVLRERQSELDALQAQINPHFLYNTLDSLYWQALNANSDKLAEDIFSLSQLFRLVLNKGESMVPIVREKELIYHYLQIQKMRFDKKLIYTIDIEDEILDYKIPKLILQPFVENAIVHGLECTGEHSMIEITGKLEGKSIVFAVKDNGIGMTKEQLRNVFEEKDENVYKSQRIGGYAIKNVKERLSIKYGEGFNLQIDSSVGVGTTVNIMLPASYE
jgi:two-component system sensor histidine kinase YesM